MVLETLTSIKKRVTEFELQYINVNIETKIFKAIFTVTIEELKRLIRDKTCLIQIKIEKALPLIAALQLAFHKKGMFSFYEFTFGMASSECRLWYFQRLHPCITENGEYWQCLKAAYQGKGHRSICPKPELKQLFYSQRDCKEKLMSKRELAYLNKLPNEITIYRTMSVDEFQSGEFGVSWTLKKSVAKHFLRIHKLFLHIESIVCEKIVSKNDIIAYFSDRKEYEVIHFTV